MSFFLFRIHEVLISDILFWVQKRGTITQRLYAWIYTSRLIAVVHVSLNQDAKSNFYGRNPA